MNDFWLGGNLYEQFMGRWSRLIAQPFLAWMAIPPAQNWLDVGCGAGALTQQILAAQQPNAVISIDSSPEFITHAQQMVIDQRVRFQVGLAQSMALDSNAVDAVVSGLVLNFVPQPEEAIAEMIRVTKPKGTIGIYLWDYADGMEMLRYFWDTAVNLNPAAKQFDEGLRFPLCQKGNLERLMQKSGLKQVEATPIEATTLFQNFDDYWTPFLGKVGPAPSYTTSLSQENQQQLETQLRQSLPINQDGSIPLIARAWAVKGIV